MICLNHDGFRYMKKGLLSIGVPVYNGSSTLRLAVSSFTTYQGELEIIILDDMSSDDSYNVALQIASSESNVSVYRNPERLGAYYTFNRLLSLANGEFFCWHAQDDRREHDYLSKCVGLLSSSGSVILAHSYFTDTGCRKYFRGAIVAPSPFFFRYRLLSYLYLFSTRLGSVVFYGIYRREFLLSVGGLPEHVGGDITLANMAALYGTVTFVPELLFNYTGRSSVRDVSTHKLFLNPQQSHRRQIFPQGLIMLYQEALSILKSPLNLFPKLLALSYVTLYEIFRVSLRLVFRTSKIFLGFRADTIASLLFADGLITRSTIHHEPSEQQLNSGSQSLEKFQCNSCGLTQTSIGQYFKELMYGTWKSYRYNRCSACGSFSISSSSSILTEDLYPSDYAPHARPGLHYNRQEGFTTFPHLVASYLKKHLRDLFAKPDIGIDALDRANLSTGSYILEVGCGSGKLCKTISKIGYRIHGIDPYLPNACSTDTAAMFTKADLFSFDVQNGTYDAILFVHSLEHIASPAETLARAYTLLKKGGKLIVCVPLVDSLAFALFSEYWIQSDAPRHFTLFTRAGIRAMAQNLGFSIIDSWSNSTEFQFVGSMQASRNIPLVSNSSIYNASLLSKVWLAYLTIRLATIVKRTNMFDVGDQATFILQK